MDPSAIAITFLSLTVLILLNKKFNHRYIYLANFLILSESIALTFLFAKFPFSLSFLLMLSTLFFIFRYEKRLNQNNSVEKHLLIKPQISKILASLTIISVLVYEYFSDQSFNSTVFLFTLISFLFFLNGNINQEYIQLYNFVILFLSLLVIIFFLPTLLYKVFFGLIGEDVSFSIVDKENIINKFLGLPLHYILSVLNFNIALDGQTISFEDTYNNKWQTVFIAESCAGTSSIAVFLIALVSYYGINFPIVKEELTFLIISGILLSYIANLFRMSLIIIIGHYFGIEKMIFVHEYLGWVIFTTWMFLFWVGLDKILNNNSIGE